MNLNLPYIKSTNEKLECKQNSRNLRSTRYKSYKSKMTEIIKRCYKEGHNPNCSFNKNNFDRETMLIPWEIKATVYSCKYFNHINKVSFMLNEV